MDNNANKNEIHIKLPDENSCEQHHREIGLFLYNKDDEHIKNALNELGIDKDLISNYEIFILLWFLCKEQYNYKHSIAFDGLDIWDMNLTYLDENTIVFVNEQNKIVFNENAYDIISKNIRDKYQGLI
ncbi:MAG: hypothetical protein J6C96_01185 [Oscillospiraceae bacterium]|nr:hypothetical protein [Oscillospiraceae bacterium]